MYLKKVQLCIHSIFFFVSDMATGYKHAGITNGSAYHLKKNYKDIYFNQKASSPLHTLDHRKANLF